MKWQKVFERQAAWEQRYYEWREEQVQAALILGPMEYKELHGSLEGWSAQVRRNERIDKELRERYQQEVEPAPALCLVIL